MKESLVIIPCYNEARNLPPLLPRLAPLKEWADLVLVDDGSRDESARLAAGAGFHVLRHETNRGYAEALRTGMKHALSRGYARCCFMDADGQHDPRFAALILEEMKTSGADMVIGSRFKEKGCYETSWGRRIAMGFFALVASLFAWQKITDTTSGMKGLNGRAMERALACGLGDFHSDLIVCLAEAKYRISEVQIEVGERKYGESMYSFKNIFFYPFKTLGAILRIKLIKPR